MKVYEFLRTGPAYRVHVLENGRRRALPTIVGGDCWVIHPLRDGVISTLMDYLDESDNRDYQSMVLANALVHSINRHVAKHCNRNWGHFCLTEKKVGAMIADAMVTSYAYKVDASVLSLDSLEYVSGQRRDQLRAAADACAVPRLVC